MPQNNEIYLLPTEVSEKIAAGEVVDRPLSIAKELVENSIDAGSDMIVLEIKNGGKSYIRVTDNGAGIPETDVEKAFQRHATSKIRIQEDLERINTLGFRGEALTSIAAVSKVEIITKTKMEKTGTRMLIEGGHIIESESVGCPDGTTIIVSDLFYNTPARHKFMKADSAEASLIIDFLSKMALAYPDIRFRMINNGAILFATRGDGNIYNNILTIYSKQIGNKLIEIDEREGEYQLQAFISSPDISRANRRGQVYFVNGRNVSDKVLETAVKTAYHERIADNRNPLAYLFLRIPSNRLDVNIHPNKKEVRFDDNNEVSQFVVNALRKGLQSKDALPSVTASNLFRKTPESDSRVAIKRDEEVQVDIKHILSTKRSSDALPTTTRTAEKYDSIKTTSYDSSQAKILEESYSYPKRNVLNIENLTTIGSIFATYILAHDEEHFYLIDQHAAHERVFYEKLLSQFNLDVKNTQILLSPEILEATPAALANMELWIDKLHKMGFDIEPFGLKALIINGIPSFMNLNQARSFLEEYIGESETLGTVIDQEKLNKIISKSCKSAVKANDKLDIEEIRHLMKALSKTENPLSCPHGRPTLLILSRQDIEKMFKRV